MCCCPWGCKELDITEWLNWTETEFTLIHEPKIPGSYAILFSTASDFTSITSHIHNWVLCSLWLHAFILSGVISPPFFSSKLGTYQPGGSSFSVISFYLFKLFLGFSRQEYWSGLPFPSHGPHVRTLHLTCPSWVALHSMAHSFTGLDKVHVVSLI